MEVVNPAPLLVLGLVLFLVALVGSTFAVRAGRRADEDKRRIDESYRRRVEELEHEVRELRRRLTKDE